MRDSELEADFPGLIDSMYEPKSQKDPNYNCVSFALGDLKTFWEDVRINGRRVPGYYWLDGVPDNTMPGWLKVFSTFGYHETDNAELEADFERIAIYGSPKIPQHVARQRASGVWVSKLGEGKDIEHTLTGLQGKLYGTVIKIMKRKCRDGRRVLE
jgi:hypothetical protein